MTQILDFEPVEERISPDEFAYRVMRIASPTERDRIEKATAEYLAKGGEIQVIPTGQVASEYFVQARAMDQQNWDAHLMKLAQKDAKLIAILSGLLGRGLMKCDMISAAGSTLYKVNRALKLYFKDDPRAKVYLDHIGKRTKK